MSHPVTSRILEIESALAEVLRNGDFRVISEDGERILIPDLHEDFTGLVLLHGMPRLNLARAARDLERLLS
ncbi:hypothetical protein KCX83_03750 [Brucella oryzae]|uniref:hypothetical protein n=1 Tax=Brucella oryzae TaxID=335286 RepID=UPI001B8211C6|nr:hypothetical protein [Brucella oryzae]MBR7651433.1 hypothetical protein [Brucella oryzae]